MVRTSRSKYIDKMEKSEFWVEETPIGAINGSNQTFTLSYAPNPVSSVELEVNGQTVVYTDDFTISSDSLTTALAYPTGTILRIRYRVEPT